MPCEAVPGRLPAGCRWGHLINPMSRCMRFRVWERSTRKKRLYTCVMTYKLKRADMPLSLSHATTVLGGALQHRRGPPLAAHCTPSPSSGAREQSELGTGVALLECSGWESHMEMSCVKMLSHRNPQDDRTMSSPATAFCDFMQERAPHCNPSYSVQAQRTCTRRHGLVRDTQGRMYASSK